MKLEVIPMKNSVTKMFLSILLITSPAMAANNCGQLDAHATESDVTSTISRTITRYKTANGGLHYVYEMDFGNDVAPSNGVGTYKVNALLNGRTSDDAGEMSCTSAGGTVVSEDCGDNGIGAVTTTPGLFLYAADGDHLNVWQGSFQVPGSPAVTFKFPQETFKDLLWTK
jgi:hypothetical protein